MRPRNPFILGHKIPRPFFCDRTVEQKKLTSAVINGRNTLIISPRRMGKTSLIHLTVNESEELRQHYLSFFFDILQTNSLSEFTYLLGKSIFDTLRSKSESLLRGFLATLKSIQGCFGFDPLTGTPTLNLQLGDIRHPEYTLDEIFSYIEQSDRPVLIAIDEFQQISKYPERNTEAILRSHIQRLANATFIFAGSEQTLLREMFVSSKRPFYNSAEIMRLGPIPEDIYVDFAKDLFRQRDKDIDDASLRDFIRLFDGNTFYMQRILNEAFAETPRGSACDDGTLRQSLHNMLVSGEAVYREILSNINASQKATLYAIAKERLAVRPTSAEFVHRHALASASSVQNSLKKLSASGLVTRDAGGYSLTDPLLRIFINTLY